MRLKAKSYMKENFYFLEEEKQEELIDKAFEALNNAIKDLKELLKGEDKENIFKFTHKIKGILLSIGLKDMAKKFEEENLKNLTLEEIKKNLEESINLILLG